MDDNKKIWDYYFSEFLECWFVYNTETKKVERQCFSEEEAKELIEKLEKMGGRQ